MLFFQRDKLYWSECRPWRIYYFLNFVIMLFILRNVSNECTKLHCLCSYFGKNLQH